MIRPHSRTACAASKRVRNGHFLELPQVQEAIAAGRALIAGFGERSRRSLPERVGLEEDAGRG